ncbi:MAG TPA: hypothetical protein DCS63_04120 [Elusimicrobia bacterium]|nr:hypothetical protein [Elusimicrobiota bacterium]
MKTLITTLLLSCCLTPARAATDCAGNADACAASSAKTSPFLAASAAEPATDKRPAAVTKETAAPGPGTPAVAAVSSATAAAPSLPASSSPLWLIFIFVSVTGLYLYLGGAGKRRKK